MAIIGEPPSLDAHWTTASLTYDVTSHLYEPLFTLDERYGVVPMLAEGHTVTDGGKTWTIRIRRGVPFHNGKECSAEDVVASITRWGRIASVGKALFKNVQSMQAKDRYTVELRFAGCSGPVLSALANASQFPAVYPKEVVDAAGDGQIKDFVGTGPFRLRGADPRPPHPHGALRPLRRAHRGPGRIRGAADGLRGRAPLHPGPGRVGAGGRRRVGRVPLQRLDLSRQLRAPRTGTPGST